LRAIPIVGPATLLLLAGVAFIQMKAYDELSISELALRVDSLPFERMGFGTLLLVWVWGAGYVTAVFVVERLIHRRKLPLDQRISWREFPGVAAVLFNVWFIWYWGLSHSMTARLHAAWVAFLVTSGLWLLDSLMSSPRTQHRDP
jgi:hypothetical protein